MNLRSTLPAVLFGLALAFPASARAQDPATNRRELLDVFNALVDDVKKNVSMETVQVPVEAPKPKGDKAALARNEDNIRQGLLKVGRRTTSVGDAKNIVKVWAELTDGADKGKKVSLTGHTWKRKEGFLLCFESALPVKFALHQKYETRGDEQKLPDPEEPRSYDHVPSGKVYKLPFVMETDDNDADEVIVLTFVQVGSGPRPPVTGDNRLTFKGAKDHRDEMGKVYADLKLKNKPARTVTSVVAVPRGDYNDVALLAVVEGEAGYVQVVLKKG